MFILLSYSYSIALSTPLTIPPFINQPENNPPTLKQVYFTNINGIRYQVTKNIEGSASNYTYSFNSGKRNRVYDDSIINTSTFNVNYRNHAYKMNLNPRLPRKQLIIQLIHVKNCIRNCL